LTEFIDCGSLNVVEGRALVTRFRDHGYKRAALQPPSSGGKLLASVLPLAIHIHFDLIYNLLDVRNIRSQALGFSFLGRRLHFAF
jgi:hypothetical protein